MITLKSAITQKLLSHFFLNPHEKLYVNELARKLSLDKRNLVKKLKELEKEGLLASRSRGNLKLYSINTKFPLYKEYKNIVLKTLGFEEELKGLLKGVPGIEKAYIYGSYAADKLEAHSDIDLLVVGEHKLMVLQKAINKLQRKIDREINIVNMDNNEFKDRRKQRDPFLKKVFKDKIIELI
ncbi:nucleotidyltransferase domain-containing protein [Patescibacteria group bacterium]|nr:nucleotidyltransferase domain-containing protein [Patescibacteria group bacterium]